MEQPHIMLLSSPMLAEKLIAQVRASRQLIYSADFQVMNELVGYLTDKCCTASGGGCAPECKPAPVVNRSRRRKAA